MRIRIILFAARQEPAPLEKPQGQRAGPALPGRTPTSARPFAVGGRLAVPSAYIAAEPGRVGQALPLPGDRVAQGGKLQAQRLQFERRPRSCGPEVATVKWSLELTVGSSSKEKPTVTKAVAVACQIACISRAATHDAPPAGQCYTQPMGRRKVYEPRCPASCGSVTNQMYWVSDPADVKLPADILSGRPPLYQIWRCSHCGFVWFQESNAYPGFAPMPVGYYDHMGSGLFAPVRSDFHVRPENTEAFWQEREEARAKRRRR